MKYVDVFTTSPLDCHVITCGAYGIANNAALYQRKQLTKDGDERTNEEVCEAEFHLKTITQIMTEEAQNNFQEQNYVQPMEHDLKAQMEEMQLSDIDENNQKQDTPSTGDADE